MEQLSSILPRAFKKQLLSRKPPVVELLGALWPRVVGKPIAQHTRPENFAGGVLTLTVSSPAWATQLREMSDALQSAINEFIGGPVVCNLRIRRRPASEPLASAPSSPGLAKPLSAAAVAEAGSYLWSGGEVNLPPELARVIERSFVKYFSHYGKRNTSCP
jgi:hypothetical protein